MIYLPTLQASKMNEILTMYVPFFETTVIGELVTRKECQKPIYFHSNTLQGAEVKYELLEKLAFAVVVVVKKL